MRCEADGVHLSKSRDIGWESAAMSHQSRNGGTRMHRAFPLNIGSGVRPTKGVQGQALDECTCMIAGRNITQGRVFLPCRLAGTVSSACCSLVVKLRGG